MICTIWIEIRIPRNNMKKTFIRRNWTKYRKINFRPKTVKVYSYKKKNIIKNHNAQDRTSVKCKKIIPRKNLFPHPPSRKFLPKYFTFYSALINTQIHEYVWRHFWAVLVTWYIVWYRSSIYTNHCTWERPFQVIFFPKQRYSQRISKESVKVKSVNPNQLKNHGIKQ